MMPVAAAAQALGYEVTYTPGKDGAPALVTVESETFRVNPTIGQEQITGVTKIEGAAGMTSPMKYGAAPRIERPARLGLPHSCLRCWAAPSPWRGTPFPSSKCLRLLQPVRTKENPLCRAGTGGCFLG